MSSQSPRSLLCQALVDPVGPADAYYMNYMYYIIILYIIHVCIKTSGLGKTETTRGIELKKREQTLMKHLLRERLCRIEFWGEEKLKSRHIWMNKSLLGKASMEKKKTFSFGHCPNNGGGFYPCPNFLALFLEVHFWSIKSLFLQKCQCIELLTVF